MHILATKWEIINCINIKFLSKKCQTISFRSVNTNYNMHRRNDMSKKYISEYELRTYSNKNQVEWKIIEGYENYIISNKQINIDKNPIDVLFYDTKKQSYRIISVNKANKTNKYLCFYVYDSHAKKKRKTFYLHRARLIAFFGPPESSDPICMHIDGNALNNNLENLKWGSHNKNMQDLARSNVNKGENSSSSKISRDLAVCLYILAQLNLLCPEIYKTLHITQSNISAIKHKRIWNHIDYDQIDELTAIALKKIENDIKKQVDQTKSDLTKKYSKTLSRFRREVINSIPKINS